MFVLTKADVLALRDVRTLEQVLQQVLGRKVSILDSIAEDTTAYPRLLADGGWVECPALRRIVSACNTYRRDGTLTETRPTPEQWRTRWAGPTEQVAGSVFYSLAADPYGNRRSDWEVLRTNADFHADARLVLPARSQINGVADAFGPTTLGLAAIDHRLLLAWLVDKRQIVKVIRPGVGGEPDGMDWWDISFARDLVSIHEV